MTPEELKIIISQPESPKLDFKREYKLNKTPPTDTDKQTWIKFINGQWDEFIKDILALTNGNVGTANQSGLLVIGADDDLLPDGTRELYDTSYLNLTEQQILDKVNGACNPPVPNIQCEKVPLDGKNIFVITIFPSPYVHETTRDLEIIKGHFDRNNSLVSLDNVSKHYTAHTLFIRRGDNIFPASDIERRTLKTDKQSHLPEGVETAGDFWREWAFVTNPPFTSGLVLAGREEQANMVRKWLNAPPDLMVVKAASGDEALAFLIAVGEKLPEAEKENFFSRCLIADDIRSYRKVSSTRNSLVLVSRFEETDFTKIAINQNHHVYVPIGFDNNVAREKVLLPRLGREAFVSALKEMGLSEEKAEKYSKDTGRSLSVMRRKLSDTGSQPKWAKLETAREILPALLMGRWQDEREADMAVLARISGKNYEDLSGILSGWLFRPDPPLYNIGGYWRLVSPMDAWFALSPYLTTNDLKKYRGIAIEVLGTEDPAFELAPDKRWMASVYGKELPHSGWLRNGIAQTLVLIAVFGEEAGIKAVISSQSFVDNIVRELLHEADWQRWSSLSDVLPLIAEASPSSFLDAVEDSLSLDTPPIMGMFSETDDFMTSGSSHSCLLWALEGLAWDPLLLGRVTSVLGKLARLDPGGKLANRPTETLRHIFFLWHPHTHAPLNVRMAALDMLFEREPEEGWKLSVALIPHHPEFCTQTSKPRWRHSDIQENEITSAECLKGMFAIKDRMLKHVGYDGNRWVEVIKEFPDFSLKDRQSVIELLSSRASEIIKERREIWDALRNILHTHRSYPDADWTISETELQEIEKIYIAFEPLEIRKCYNWLFDSYAPKLPSGRKNFSTLSDEWADSIKQARTQAVAHIYETEGTDDIIAFAEEISYPWLLGTTMAEVSMKASEKDKLLFLSIQAHSEPILNFAQGYVFRCFNLKGDDWIKRIVIKAREHNWQADAIVNFFLALPEKREIWDQIESFSSEAHKRYWSKCGAQFYHIPFDDKIFGIRQLLMAKRCFTALDAAAMMAKELPSSLILEILEKTATAPEETKYVDRFDSHTFAHHITELFEALDNVKNIDESQIAKLEWAYLPILAKPWGWGGGRSCKILHKTIAEDPVFFAEIIKCIYKSKNVENIEDNEIGFSQEMIEQRANSAYELINSWSIVPGSGSDGKIDTDILLNWVKEARRLCAASGRKDIGDSHIGNILAYAKTEYEEFWPPVAVCHIIDMVQNSRLESGFYTGIKNKRGGTTRSPSEGGKQERELAARFRGYAGKLVPRWPRTVSVLSKIAESYECEAKLQDQEAERRDLEC